MSKLIQSAAARIVFRPGWMVELKIKIQYFAIVREIVGRRQEILDLDPDMTVIDLLELLATRYGEKFRQYIFDPNTRKPKPYLQFLVNEESIAGLEGFSTTLSDNSTFAIIPPVGGG